MNSFNLLSTHLRALVFSLTSVTSVFHLRTCFSSCCHAGSSGGRMFTITAPLLRTRVFKTGVIPPPSEVYVFPGRTLSFRDMSPNVQTGFT